MFNDDFLKKINFFLYQKKHLIIYAIIGFLSLIFELSVRKLIYIHVSTNLFFLHISIIFGVIFAFYFNIKLNFNVPKIYLRRSLFYFFLISTCSYLFQYFIGNKLELSQYSFEESRLIISGSFFLVAYFFHTKFSFKDSRKVGVAIYANGYEDISKIFNRIGPYPNFIHVDIVDKTMNKNALDTNLSKLEEVKAYWPKHKIETHIMSNDPLNLIDDKIIDNSDIIYIHHEIKNKELVVEKILKKNKIPGLALHSIYKYKKLEEIIGNFKEILILSIKNPGFSGQQFNEETYNLIERINLLQTRNKLAVCVDGGVKSNLINKFTSEKVVSGSDVLNSEHPVKKIMKLQTVARYEK
jgi:pentose-5-phosphate-3-epimerase